MDEVDRHRAFTDGGGDPLHRIEPNIAGRENPKHNRLEREGGRASGHRCSDPGRMRSWPVTTNPRSSRTMWGPSQSVRGDAPIKMNNQLEGTSSVMPVSVSARVSDSRWPAPRTATTSLWYRTVMLRAAVILAIKYDDMVSVERASAYD